MPDVLLARYADCIFWLARYIERAENLARILDVNETFSRDSRGGQNWRSIVQLNSDEERFFARHDAASVQSVVNFYVIDGDNPNSIVSAIRYARENARTLRPLISTEMWVQLNVFYNRLAALCEADLAPGNLAALFATIKEACQTHTGITEGTFFRDQGWYFYQIGRYIERADQTTRLLDIKYHLLLPSVSDVGSPVDVSQWNALLRSAAGYHAYRRLHAASTTPARVAGFMLLNTAFPRSVHHCVREVGQLLGGVKSHHGLRHGNDAAEELDRLQVLLGTLEIRAILKSGLHEFLDSIQRQLIAITRELSIAFFGYIPEPSQAQTASPQ
ncbi:MAG: alpha-E domain-containing protein [Alphaproteobacteria bacterium]|nr:alpha-E domain-containing protein [Alphaproteobacteria bacterium]